MCNVSNRFPVRALYFVHFAYPLRLLYRTRIAHRHPIQGAKDSPRFFIVVHHLSVTNHMFHPRDYSSIQAIGVPPSGLVALSSRQGAFKLQRNAHGEACYCCCAVVPDGDHPLDSLPVSTALSGTTVLFGVCCYRCLSIPQLRLVLFEWDLCDESRFVETSKVSSTGLTRL